MVESWRNIQGYDAQYQVDREGNVRHVYPSGRIMMLKPHPKASARNHKYIVRLMKNGKPVEAIVIQLVANAFLGPCPKGCVPYHINGCQSDNNVNNIEYISLEKLGRLTGGRSRRKPVVKKTVDGEIVDVYYSAREAARKNYMGYQTVIDRCNGKRKERIASDGYIYEWDK